jgi:hypothetical protein
VQHGGERAIPIDFLDYAFNIRKQASVLEVWKAVGSYNAINLRLCLRENLRV